MDNKTVSDFFETIKKLDKYNNIKNIEEIQKVFNTILKNINEEENQKEFNQMRELGNTLVDLIKKMYAANSTSDSTEFNRLKEVYNITDERLKKMRQERNEKYNKYKDLLESII